MSTLKNIDLRIPKKTLEDLFALEDFQHDFNLIVDTLAKASSDSDVKDFGAIGDGIADDTVALQNALNNGGSIFISEGTYNISKALLIDSNTTLRFSHNAVIVRKAKGTMLLTKTSDSTTGFNGAKNINIYGGKLKHDGDLTPGNVITLFHADSVEIKGITVENIVGSHAIDIVGSNNVSVEAVNFEGYIPDGDTQKEVIQLDVAYASSYPLYDSSAAAYDGTASKNITIKDCLFKASETQKAPVNAIGQHVQVKASNGKISNIKILNNEIWGAFDSSSITGTYGYGIRLIGMENVLVEGNKIHNFKTGIFLDITNTIYNPDGTSQNSVSLADSKYVGCSNVRVINNTIYTSETDRSKSGIWLNIAGGALNSGIRHKDIIIEGNTIHDDKSNTASALIELETVDNCIIQNNILVGKRDVSKIGIFVVEKANNIVIGENVYSDIEEINEFKNTSDEKVTKMGRTLLWTGTLKKLNTTADLSDKISNYKSILVQYSFLGIGYRELTFPDSSRQSIREFNLTDAATPAGDVAMMEFGLKKTGEKTLELVGNKYITVKTSGNTVETATGEIKAIWGIN